MTAMTGGTKTGNLTPEEQNIDRKRSRSEQSSCAFVIHCADDDTKIIRQMMRNPGVAL